MLSVTWYYDKKENTFNELVFFILLLVYSDNARYLSINFPNINIKHTHITKTFFQTLFHSAFVTARYIYFMSVKIETGESNLLFKEMQF